MDYSNNQNNSDIGSSSNGINQFLYSNAEQNQSHDSFNDMQNIGQQPNRQQRPQSSYANAQKMAQMQKVKEMQKQQYQQKKKLIFGDGQRIGPEDDRFSLDKMKLDGDDKGGAAHMFDPFAKKDILDLQLQAQMNIMNIDNTYGNKFWTPEQQQKMAALRQQQLEQNDNLEEIPDNIRHYNPDAQGFTEAHKQNYPKYSQSVADPNNPNNSQLNGSGYNMNQVQYGNMDTRKGNHEQPKKFLNTDRNEVENQNCNTMQQNIFNKQYLQILSDKIMASSVKFIKFIKDFFKLNCHIYNYFWKKQIRNFFNLICCYIVNYSCILLIFFLLNPFLNKLTFQIQFLLNYTFLSNTLITFHLQFLLTITI